MRLTDTLTGAPVDISPNGRELRVYVCGVTPYSDAHLGHAMSYIIFDVLRRYLEYRGVRMKHVQNFTDVDDRIIDRANAQGIAPDALAQRYIDDFFADMDALNVQRAHVYPRATQEIPEMVSIIEALIEKGFAYPAAGGDVYFRVRRKADYGKLSHRDIDQLQAGARVEPGAAKEDPLDFALWKGAKPGEPSWDSPWGPGRPGWHIECTAMSLKYLGDDQPIDIHGGGHDLIFPHHENEIAQSEAYTGRQPFARCWVHNGWLQLGSEKMSKSLGNIVTIREGVERFGADALRAFVLGSHYRAPLTYSDDIIEAARRGVDRLRAAADVDGPAADGDGVNAAPYRDRFLAAMDDDLNTPGALAALHDLAREINRGRDQGRDISDAQAALQELGGILGLRLDPPENDHALEAAPFVELLIRIRADLRKAKQYDLADGVRAGLAELGIELEDTAEGTVWRAGADH